MIHSIEGVISAKREDFFIINTESIGFKISASAGTLSKLPQAGNRVKVFCYLYFRENVLELYGFVEEKELNLFEKLISVSGIGPRSALGILGITKIDQLIAAINEGKSDLLVRASGVGKKTAERIALELKGKLDIFDSPQMISLMESDVELEETLVSLGFSRIQAKSAISNIDPKVTSFKERLKAALKQGKIMGK